MHKNRDNASCLKYERKKLNNLRINIKNSNPNIGYKNVDTTIRNFHRHSKFHNHKNTKKKKNINITIGKNLYKINKIEHHLNKKKKSPTNLKHQNKKYSH